MSGMDFKSISSLLGMITDAVRGSTEAKAAFEAMLTRPGNAQELLAWIRRFVPMGGNPMRPELLGQQIEDMARMMGFVPRSRYLELLERHEILRQKLEDAEKTIQRLQAAFATGGNPTTARKLLDGLAATVDGALKKQAEFLQSVSEVFAKPRKTDDAKPEDEKTEKKSPNGKK